MPEIQRTSLAGTVLYLKTLPVPVDVLRFDFLDRPDEEQLKDALRQLYALGAIDVDGAVTEVGRRMSEIPVEPSLARSLLAAKDLGCVPEVSSRSLSACVGVLQRSAGRRDLRHVQVKVRVTRRDDD